MRIWFVLLATGLSFVSNLGSSRANELVGCPDPELVADSLTKIEKADWQNLPDSALTRFEPLNL